MGRKSAVKREREIGKLKTEVSVLQTRFAVLSGGYRVLREENETIERVFKVALKDIEALKQSNFDYQIKLLSSSLDEAQRIIDKLQNTVWRRFCRWIRLLFTV